MFLYFLDLLSIQISSAFIPILLSLSLFQYSDIILIFQIGNIISAVMWPLQKCHPKFYGEKQRKLQKMQQRTGEIPSAAVQFALFRFPYGSLLGSRKNDENSPQLFRGNIKKKSWNLTISGLSGGDCWTRTSDLLRVKGPRGSIAPARRQFSSTICSAGVNNE